MLNPVELSCDVYQRKRLPKMAYLCVILDLVMIHVF